MSFSSLHVTTRHTTQFCRPKFCRDKSGGNFCRDKYLSPQKFCRDKRRKTHDKTFVATRMIRVSAPANDTKQFSQNGQFIVKQPLGFQTDGSLENRNVTLD